MCQVLHLGNYIWETKVCTVFLFFVGNFISFFSRIVFKGCISNYLQPFPPKPNLHYVTFSTRIPIFLRAPPLPISKKKIGFVAGIQDTLSLFWWGLFFADRKKVRNAIRRHKILLQKWRKERVFFTRKEKKWHLLTKTVTFCTKKSLNRCFFYLGQKLLWKFISKTCFCQKSESFFHFLIFLRKKNFQA